MPKWPRLNRTTDARREADSLNEAGVSLMAEGRFEEAKVACEQAAAIYRRIGDPHGEAAALSNEGQALNNLGDKLRASQVNYNATEEANQSSASKVITALNG